MPKCRVTRGPRRGLGVYRHRRGTQGEVALGFGGYLGSITPVPIVLGALGLITATALLAWWGIGESVALAVVFTIVEIGGLVFIIAVGVPDWGSVDYFSTPQGFGGIWTASALVLFAYLGFDELGNLAEETRRPERTLPVALAIAFAISSVIYVLVAISAVSAVGWEVLAGSDAPLAEVASKALGGNAGRMLTLVALAATANTVLLLLVAGSRSLQGMASSGVLPGALARIGRRRTPWIALIVTWLVSICFALIGDLELVAGITNAAILFSFVIVNLALIRTLRRLRKGASLRGLVFDLLIPGGAAISCLALLARTGGVAIGLAAVLGIVGLVGGGLLGQRGRESGAVV
ncbi:MAG: amino acid permease [SAR202 cluster bacterium]|nr:amino acid permease [SAR202 cluster bacterium]